MTEQSVITQEMKDMLGKEYSREVIEVEKGHIRKFVQAIGDPNPLYQDEVAAKKSRYGGIIAPPTFAIDIGLLKIADKLMEIECPLTGFLNGGTEIEYFKPIRAGDIITTSAKLIDMQEKTGQSGKLLFMILEVTYTNQKNELVAKCRETFIRR
jgi:acyl dehydratase